MRFYFLDFFRQCGTKTHGVFLQEGVQGKGLPREALGARGGGSDFIVIFRPKTFSQSLLA